MTRTPDADAAEAARLRAAHELLDERPSPKVRAAVLSAAAGTARGHPVVDSVRASRRFPDRRWFGWRPAVAAGTTIAVGILAIGISVHVEHEKPSEGRNAPAAAPISPAPSAPATESGAAATQVPAPRPSIPAALPRAAAQAYRLGEPAENTPPGGASQDQQSSRVKSAAPSSRAPKSALAPAAPAPAPPTAPAPMREAAPTTAPRAGTSLAKPRQADQGRAQDAGAERARLAASPDDWLRRIIELRRAGRDAQADDELARFRNAFPNVKVPDDALK